MYVCHECGRDNSNNMKNGGWLDSYADGGSMQEHQENYNDNSVSLPEGFVGEGYNTKGRDYSPAWGGQFEDGGLIPMAQKGEKIKYVESKNDPRYKAYQDSLSLYKTSLKNMWAEKNKSKSKVTKKGFIPFDKFDTFVLGSNLEYNDENRYPGENFEAHKKKSTVVSKRKLNSLIKNNIKPIGFDINEWKSGINSKPVLNYSTVYKKPQQQVIVNPLQPKVEAINLPPMQNQDPSFLKQELDLIRPIQAPKSYNVNMQRYNMQGPSDYYNYNQEGVDYETAMRVQRATEAYNKYIEEKYGNPEALKNPKAAERLKQLRQDVQLTPQYQMGGSIPGAVGFTYARTKGIPSEGPYAKKTMPSAQNGQEMKYYQEGLDWRPKTISKNGSVIKDDMGQWAHPGEITEINSPYITMQGVPYPVLGISDTGDTQMMYPEEEYEFDGTKVTEFPMAKNGLRQEQKGLVNLDQLTNFTNYNTKQPGGWMDKYQ
jgi:hypothetical protein